MGDVLRQIGSSADYFPSGMMDDGFCGLDPRAWIRFSRGSNKGSEFEDRNNGSNQRNRVNLLYYEELRTLSQTNLKLTFHPSDSSPKKMSGSEISIEAEKKPKRTCWSRPLPQLASFRCVAGSVPKIRVRTSDGESVLGSKRTNPVFRSNSFRYEKYSTNDPNLDTVSEKSAINSKKVKKRTIFDLQISLTTNIYIRLGFFFVLEPSIFIMLLVVFSKGMTQD